MKLLLWDTRIFEVFNRLVGINSYLDFGLTMVSAYLIYLIPFFLVVLWFVSPKLREVSWRAALVGAVGWRVVTPLIAQIWFRERPIDNPMIPAKELVFHRPTYSFPSDHALFLFALAGSFYFGGEKKIAFLLYTAAILVSFSRVVVGIHFPLDVLAGGLIGVAMAWLGWRYQTRLDPIIVRPFITVAKWLHLG